MTDKRTNALIRVAAPLAGALAVLTGGFWLAAWFAGWAGRWSARGTITIKTNMALCLLVGGIALLLQERAKLTRWVRIAGTALSMFVGLLSLATFLEHIFRLDLKIDELLAVEAPGATATASPNRMGLPGALAFVLLGIGLLALFWGRRKLGRALGLTVCVITLVPTVGYMYGIASFYARANLMGIAWPTVVGLIALGGGLMMARNARDPDSLLFEPDQAGRLWRRMLPVLVFVPLALGFLWLRVQAAGTVSAATGTGLLVLALILVFGWFLWWGARQLSRSIVEEKRADQALRESEVRSSALIKYAPTGIYEIDYRGPSFLSVNDAMCVLTGYTREELMSLGPEVLLGDESRQLFAERIKRQRAGEPIDESVSYKVRKKDGTTIDVTLNVALSKEKPHTALVIGHDVTERMRMEEELQTALQRVKTFVQNMHGSFLLVGSEGVVLANQEFCDYFEIEDCPENLVGTKTADMIDKVRKAYLHPDEEVVRIQEILDRGEPVIGEELVMHDGRTCLRDFIPIYKDGKSYGRIWQHQDITERKRAETALKESEERFRAAQELSPDGFTVLRPVRGSEGRVEDFVWMFENDAVAGMNGTDPKAVIGHRLLELFPDHRGTPIFEAYRNVAETGKAQVFETSYRGETIPKQTWFRLAVVPMGGGDIAVLAQDVTERKTAEEELARSHQRSAQRLDSIQEDFYVLNRDWVFVYASRQFTSRVGKAPEDFVGRNIWEMFPQHVGTIIEENFRASMEQREVRRFEMPGKYTDAWYSMTSYPSPEGITVLGTDITQRKRAEALVRALQEQERLRLGAAVEQASESVVMVDLEGKILYANAAFESTNQIPRREAVGRPYADLIPGDPAVSGIREIIAKGKTWHGPLARTLADGRQVELEVTISPTISPSGEVIGGLITEKDITRESALERQVRQAQKMEALGTLAGGITHDFNNILGAIIVNTELALLDLDLADPARKPLPLVLQAANRGKELVKQIITFSRQREWERRPLEVGPVAREAIKFLRSTLPKDVVIHETVDPAAGDVLGDPSHIHQILVNLCQNAALAMREKGGDLEIKVEPVEVGEAEALRQPDLKPGPYVRIMVSDTGCGIPRENFERIFEPFFTTRGPGAGSGLGLAVVHGIVRSYGGTIKLSSELGQGSVFSVYLPRLENASARSETAESVQPIRGEARILLVEDEDSQRDSLSRSLARLGYKVTARASGRAALSAAQKDPSAFDLVITDQIMPRMPGLELAKALHKIRPDMPIVLCTGFSDRIDGDAMRQSGVREFIMKPFTLQEITRLIDKVVKKKESRE